ncbi:sulfite oxidase [Mycobacterium aquaticum]|uniref:Sulfite oxidase n=1 Tax=Mycobacterium aquaticum TaxID=1927124 RepID=A0A1X0AWV5_9MYCO|nr:sulfite oxidase [Mycobacterium aquaticum]
MWGKRADVIVRTEAPFNAEPPPTLLAANEITPVEAFYARNHGLFPDIAPGQWRLDVGGLVDTPMTLTLDRLTTGFDHHTVVATLACAGNRRAELLRARPIPGKDPWEHGAISTAAWCGVRLADVLDAAGVYRRDGLHVEFLAPDIAAEARPAQAYGSSIPLEKAMSHEVLLAWQMNGQPLPRAHGGPVRAVVPGYIGARSVKWITAVTVRDHPSHNYFQEVDYRILPPDADPDTAAVGDGIPLSRLPLNCDILAPTGGDRIGAGEVVLRGWAMAGDGQGIGRVDVSIDGGHTWRQAQLHTARSKWAWSLWSLSVDVVPGPLSITARAWDDTGMTQPESPASLWNPRGYGNNAYSRVDVRVM